MASFIFKKCVIFKTLTYSHPLTINIGAHISLSIIQWALYTAAVNMSPFIVVFCFWNYVVSVALQATSNATPTHQISRNYSRHEEAMEEDDDPPSTASSHSHPNGNAENIPAGRKAQVRRPGKRSVATRQGDKVYHQIPSQSSDQMDFFPIAFAFRSETCLHYRFIFLV